MADTMVEICETIHRDIADIVERWLKAAQEEPWFATPKEQMIDELPEVIRLLAEVALCSPGDADLHREKVMAAARHGQERKIQGLDTEVVFREYHFLRVSLWRYLQDRVDDEGARLNAITRVDMAISIASRASLYGHHQSELEEAGEWPDRVQRLADESRLLTEFRK